MRGFNIYLFFLNLKLEEILVLLQPPKNVRYLRCPAGVTIGILKKFVRLKYELPNRYEVSNK